MPGCLGAWVRGCVGAWVPGCVPAAGYPAHPSPVFLVERLPEPHYIPPHPRTRTKVNEGRWLSPQPPSSTAARLLTPSKHVIRAQHVLLNEQRCELQDAGPSHPTETTPTRVRILKDRQQPWPGGTAGGSVLPGPGGGEFDPQSGWGLGCRLDPRSGSTSVFLSLSLSQKSMNTPSGEGFFKGHGDVEAYCCGCLFCFSAD